MRYLVREKMFAVGDDFWVRDEHGTTAFLVDGKALRLREAFELKDAEGRVLVTVRRKLLAARETFQIRQDGDVVARVRKAWFSPLRHRFVVRLSGGETMDVVGDLWEKEFDLRVGGETVAAVSRKWFRLRDTYGVDIAPGADEPLILAIAVCVDRIIRSPRDRDDSE